MKRSIHLWVFIFIAFISCSKKEIITVEEVSCQNIGLGSDHSNHIEFQSILDELIEDGYPGVTATIFTSDGLWSGAAGKADVKNDITMQPCHVSHSGSFAKMYTVTAAMILWEQGLLDIDSKIKNYISKELSENLPNGKTATVRQLMNHSAGMPDHDNDEALSKYTDDHDQHLPSAQAQLAYLFDDKPRFYPGSKSEYSSAHTLTLSLVLDSIYGEHHSQIISREIVDKLALSETFYKNESGYPKPQNLTKGYIGKRKDATQEAINYASTSQGDAGIMATSHDYYLFLRALMEYNIVSKETMDEMLEPFWWVEFGQGEGIGVGLGPFIMKRNDEIIKVGHGGVTLGGMTHVYYYPIQNAYISLATNTVTDKDLDMYNRWAGNFAPNPEGASIIERFEKIILNL